MIGCAPRLPNELNPQYAAPMSSSLGFLATGDVHVTTPFPECGEVRDGPRWSEAALVTQSSQRWSASLDLVTDTINSLRARSVNTLGVDGRHSWQTPAFSASAHVVGCTKTYSSKYAVAGCGQAPCGREASAAADGCGLQLALQLYTAMVPLHVVRARRQWTVSRNIFKRPQLTATSPCPVLVGHHVVGSRLRHPASPLRRPLPGRPHAAENAARLPIQRARVLVIKLQVVEELRQDLRTHDVATT